MSSTFKPIIKWAGGKKALSDQLSKIILEQLDKFDRYVEPFFGGGGVFFTLNNNIFFNASEKKIIINDINKNLMNLYKDIKRDPITLMKTHEKVKQQYQDNGFYYIRDRYNGSKGQPYKGIYKSAALMVLNKTCYNGLYRVNKSGQFNVPEGKYETPSFVKENDLFLTSTVLPNLKNIQSKSYEKIQIRKNDLVYLDPPYDIENKNSFTSYAGDFRQSEQEKLHKYFEKIDKIGAKVIMSNSNTKRMRDLYSNHNIKKIFAPRGISPKSSRKAKELIILGKNFFN